MFIMSLAAADLTVGAIVMPISSVYALTGKPDRDALKDIDVSFTQAGNIKFALLIESY